MAQPPAKGEDGQDDQDGQKGARGASCASGADGASCVARSDSADGVTGAVGWTGVDNQALREALCQHGLKRWERISDTLGQRFSAAECKAQWVTVLNPLTAPRRAWSAGDDALLRDTVHLVDGMDVGAS